MPVEPSRGPQQTSDQTVGRSDALHALADNGRLRSDLVRTALQAGASWEDIGEAIGISRHGGWARFQEQQQQEHWAKCWAIPGPVGAPQADRVRRALEAGATWEDVGETLGISRRGAWARYWEGVQKAHLDKCWAIPGPVEQLPQ